MSSAVMDVKCFLPVKEHELLINHMEHAIKASCQDAESNSASPLLEQMGFIIVEFVKWKWKAVAVEWVDLVRCITVPLVYMTDGLRLYMRSRNSTHVMHLLCLSRIFVVCSLLFHLNYGFMVYTNPAVADSAQLDLNAGLCVPVWALFKLLWDIFFPFYLHLWQIEIV